MKTSLFSPNVPIFPVTTGCKEQRSFDPKVTAHFQASAELYRSWSPEGHLHFGYWRWPMDPFRRKPMLEELVHETVRPLRPVAGMRLADLGCGYGTAARMVARRYGAQIDAFTVVPEQVEEGAMAALHDGTFDRVTMHLRDFRDTGLPDASLDGAYAVESLCYAAGRGKGEAVKEIARILKPGATLAVMDGFLVRRPRGWRKALVGAVADGWAVPCFPNLYAFITELWRQGFRNVDVRDISWRLGPSGLHGLPLLALTLLRQLFSKTKMDALEKAHLRSCALGILLGTQHDLFRYCMITATRT